MADPETHAENGPMSLVKWIFIGLVVLPAAELIALVLVAALIGWLATIALFVATSIAGLLFLRRSGRADLARLRHSFIHEGIRAIRLETPGAAPVLGGILLVFPGFITDALGAALFVPPLRRWVAGKVAATAPRPRRGRDDRVIDLAPGEWHRIPDRRRRRRRKAKGEA